MARVSRPISREELSGYIDNASQKEAIEIGDAEEAVIKEIIASFPESEKKNTASIGKWCNGKVKEILSIHPELQASAESIQKRVRLELVYKLQEAEFDDLKRIIEEKKPAKVTPMWIRENTRRFAYLVNANNLNWALVAEKIGIPIEQQPSSFADVMRRVNEKLKLANPDFISPGYIQDNLVSDYVYFRRNTITESGKIDWEQVKANLDPELQSKWKQLAVYDEAKPKTTYRDEPELNDFLARNQEKLFTVVEASPGDRQDREEVIKGLVLLAKRGNDSAFDKALEYLEFVVRSWIAENRLDPVLMNYKDEANERIARSIYLYNNSGDFLTYLFVSLARLGKGLRGYTIEYDANNREQNDNQTTPEDYHFRDEPSDDF